MGKKKQQHQSQSFGQMVSKAALTNLLPHIQNMVNQLGQRLAVGQATTYEKMFTRIIAIEKILFNKELTTQDGLNDLIAEIEDKREGFESADELQMGDTARISVTTKTQQETEYTNGTTALKVVNCGSGDTIGKEVEEPLLGMKIGETRTVRSSSDENALDVKITLNRASRRPKVEEAKVAATEETAKTEETSNDQVQG